MLKEGEDRSNTTEAANLEALAKQRERLHAKSQRERGMQIRRLEAHIADKASQNEAVAVHLVQLEKVGGGAHCGQGIPERGGGCAPGAAGEGGGGRGGRQQRRDQGRVGAENPSCRCV